MKKLTTALCAFALGFAAATAPAFCDPSPNAKTYQVATAGITVPALPTDLACFQANASTGAQIMTISVNGHAAAAATASVQIIKRSTVDTGGTPTTFTGVPRVTGDAAATASLLAYTAVPTPLGTTVGILDEEDALLVPGGSTTGGNPATFDFTKGKPLTVKGTEAICVAVPATTSAFAGATLEMTVTWQE